MNTLEMWMDYVDDLSKDYQVLLFDYLQELRTNQALKGHILLILPDQDFFSGKMQEDLIQLMHNPKIAYVSGGHLSTILKAEDYIKTIRDFLNAEK